MELGKTFSPQMPAVSRAKLAQIVAELRQQVRQSPLEEIKQQNQELLRTLAELRKRQEELTQLNHELADTNRGVLALYAEEADRLDAFLNGHRDHVTWWGGLNAGEWDTVTRQRQVELLEAVREIEAQALASLQDVLAAEG